jgi:hypothetical protein
MARGPPPAHGQNEFVQSKNKIKTVLHKITAGIHVHISIPLSVAKVSQWSGFYWTKFHLSNLVYE